MTARINVRLGAIAHNYQLCAKALSTLPLQVATAAVVKANAYGLGVNEVANTLLQQGCRDFFVATAAEGRQLRQHLPGDIPAEIYVFAGAQADSAAVLREARLTPVLNSPEMLALWTKLNEGNGSWPLVLHLDTGMHRLGFSEAQLANVDLPKPPSLLLTHFARADEPGHPTIDQQIARFVAAAERFPGCVLSVGNSAATLASNSLSEGLQSLAGRSLLARPGIALYGGQPFTEPNALAAKLQTALQLEGQVLQVRSVAKGEPIGYGGTYVAAADISVAVVGLGYADGLPRLLSNQGAAAVNGVRCPIVGRVSMDLTCIDVSAAAVAPGDWVEFIGDTVSLQEVAQLAQTIDYEVLTGLGVRAERHYFGGSGRLG